LCDTKALLRHHHGLAARGPEPSYFTAGRAAHEAHAVWLRGGAAEEALARFRDDYAAVAPADPLDRLSYENTSTILRAWYETHPRELLPFEIADPAHVEVGFQLPLTQHGDTEIVFYGRLDALVRCKRTGRWFVLDHKHPSWCRRTGDRDYFDRFVGDSQMSGYVWAAAQTLGEPVAGVWINAIEFSRLPGAGEPKRKCRGHGLPYAQCRTEHVVSTMRELTRTPQQLEGWHANAVRLAQQYAALCERHPALADVSAAAQQGIFYGACAWCDFKFFCEANRPVAWAAGMLEHRPWTPFTETE
jgi:hypothetical protein